MQEAGLLDSKFSTDFFMSVQMALQFKHVQSICMSNVAEIISDKHRLRPRCERKGGTLDSNFEEELVSSAKERGGG